MGANTECSSDRSYDCSKQGSQAVAQVQASEEHQALTFSAANQIVGWMKRSQVASTL